MKKKTTDGPGIPVNVSGTGQISFEKVMWPTANLRWRKGVLQQMWCGMNGEQEWKSVSTEELQEGEDK